MRKYLVTLSLIVLVLTAATAFDSRKVTLALENFSSDWAFVSKAAGLNATQRKFIDEDGNQVWVIVTKHKTLGKAKYQFGQNRGNDESDGFNTARPAPLRSVDDFYSVLGSHVKSYHIREGQVILEIIFFGSEKPSDAKFLQCEALQFDRLLTPNKSGVCQF